MSKGSAFVKFATPEAAQLCIDAFRTHRGNIHSGLLIKDRECKADLAVNKEKIQNLKELKSREKHGLRPHDKRNLYLANEGLLIDSNGGVNNKNNKDNKDNLNIKSTPNIHLSQLDIDKRKKAQMDKRKKLTNPLFFVSSKRLSVRNLPKSMADPELKIMCLKAMKAGLKNNRVTIVDIQAQLQAQGELDNSTTNNDELMKIPEFDNKGVLTAKVMLDLAKVK